MKLIDKDALVAEIERKIEGINPLSQRVGIVGCSNTIKHLMGILSFIDTLEVKEVDLTKEISFQWSKFCLYEKDKDSFVKVAKHFFELGLKEQKRE